MSPTSWLTILFILAFSCRQAPSALPTTCACYTHKVSLECTVPCGTWLAFKSWPFKTRLRLIMFWTPPKFKAFTSMSPPCLAVPPQQKSSYEQHKVAPKGFVGWHKCHRGLSQRNKPKRVLGQAKACLGTSPCLSQVLFQNPVTQFRKVNLGIEPQFVGLYSYVTVVFQDGWVCLFHPIQKFMAFVHRPVV